MKKLLISTIAAAAVFSLNSCKNDFDTDVNNMTVSNGSANFSKYIALGNSLTSGFRDNALYADGQNESYPSMIAKQMMLAGGSQTFNQPLMPNNIGGFTNLPGFGGKLTLQVVNGSLSPVASDPAAALDNVTAQGPYQNLGVAGAKSFHLGLAGYGNAANLAAGKANPYYVRFATSATSSVIQDALAQNPTFYSLWIGSNDVLSYATSGGSGVDQTGNLNPATYGSNDISDPAVVKSAINSYLAALKAKGAKGVIANIPNVTSIPFFTTVPYNPVALDATTATTLNQQLYGPLKQVLTAFGQGSRINLLSAGNNPLLIKDKELTNMSAQITGGLTAAGIPATQAAALGAYFGQARQATAKDLILLSASSVIGKNPASNPAPFDKLGVTFPMDDKYVLSEGEAAKVATATTAYNSAIADLANTYGLALVDANAKMVELSSASGLQYDAVKYSAKFITGGTFSLDGVHLTGRGYALIANEFIKAINAKYGSTLPQVVANQYSGVKFP